MKRRDFIRTSSMLGGAAFVPQQHQLTPNKRVNSTPRIFVTGGSADDLMMKFFMSLTGKDNPRICLLPTASADNDARIVSWFQRGPELGFEAYAQKMFISSYRQKEDFETVLLNMDAIWVSGGNTLNMIAIWKAQGVDEILRKAWQQGIVLGGGSAGSICWFEQGNTDSRPKELSAMEALGFLKGSHCPHVQSEGPRRDSYHSMILDGRLKAGYALDDRIGVLFENQEVKKIVTSREGSKGFYVSKANGKIVEKELYAEVLSE